MNESSLTPRPRVVPSVQEERREKTAKQNNASKAALYFRRSAVAALLMVAAISSFYLEIVDASVVLTAVATIMLALFTWTLSDATDQMRQGADDSLNHQIAATERDERGYVFFDRQLIPSYDTDFRIIFKNFGKTPVREVQVFGYVSPQPDDENNRVTEVANVALPPSGEYDVAFTPKPAVDGTYIHGRVEYFDGLSPTKRCTRFRYRLRAADGRLLNCAEGNDWT